MHRCKVAELNCVVGWQEADNRQKAKLSEAKSALKQAEQTLARDRADFEAKKLVLGAQVAGALNEADLLHKRAEAAAEALQAAREEAQEQVTTIYSV